VTRLARTARAEALEMPPFLVAVVLPVPPSINSQYIHTRYGTRLTPAAEAFRQEAVFLMREALHGAQWPSSAFCRVTLQAWFPNEKRPRDIDNILKITIDAAAAALGFNDKQVREVHAYHRGYDKNDPRCELYIEVMP
jgi:Holliday junction resolvase RusA-like endonuclease